MPFLEIMIQIVAYLIQDVQIIVSQTIQLAYVLQNVQDIQILMGIILQKDVSQHVLTSLTYLLIHLANNVFLVVQMVLTHRIIPEDVCLIAQLH